MTRRLSFPPKAGLAPRVAAIAIAAACALTCSPSQAGETKALRLGAGEHGDYSRVVLNGAPRGGWNVLSGERRFDLRLPGHYGAIDDIAVTRQRRAHRITGLVKRREGPETVLSFTLNCDCVAKPRVAASGLLIVDVSPRAAAGRKAEEDAGAIETASTPRTAPLDVEGARAFLMSQLQRAAKQGLIRYKDDKTPQPQGAEPAAKTVQESSKSQAAPKKTAPAPQHASAHAGDPKNSPAIDLAPAPAEKMAVQAQKPAPKDEHAHGSKHASPVAKVAAEKPAAPKAQKPQNAAADAKQSYDKKSLKDFFSKKHKARADTDAQTKHAKSAPSHAGDARKSEGEASAHKTPHHAPAGKKPPARKAPTLKTPEPKMAKKPERHAGQHVDHHGAAPKEHGPKADAEEKAPPPPMDAACPEEDLLDPRGWPYGEEYNAALAERRSALFDDLNRVDPTAVTQMQLLHLAHGLGHEAAAAPKGFRTDDDRVALLAALGDVVAQRKAAPGSAFNRVLPCPGWQAFWQAVALAPFEPNRAIEAYRLSQRALWRTPTALRRMMGERIALAAAQSGELQTAAEILAVLERSQVPPTPAIRLVRAELALDDGRTVAAQQELKIVANSRDENNLQAALRLAASFSKPYETGRALELADLLADFAMQRRGGEDMIKAITAEARLRARYGRLPDALTAIAVSKKYGGYGAQTLEALRVALLDEAVASLGGENDEAGYVTGDAKGHGGKTKRRSAKLDKRALALAAQLVEQIGALPPGEENDRIRTDLAQQVTALGAPHLTRLVIDGGLAGRSKRAEKARLDAARAAALIDPLGALNGGSDALSKSPTRNAADELLAELEAAEAKAVEKATTQEAPKAEKSQQDKKRTAALERLRAAKGAPANPAATIEDGQSLLKGVAADLEILRALTKGQRASAAPETAPAAGNAGKGDQDG